MGLVLLSYLGLCISVWPYIVPRTLTFWDAAVAPSTQLFALIGFVRRIPVVILTEATVIVTAARFKTQLNDLPPLSISLTLHRSDLPGAFGTGVAKYPLREDESHRGHVQRIKPELLIIVMEVGYEFGSIE